MHQLVYASAALRPFNGDELRGMLTRARKFNGLHGISGMLMYHARSILQVLEGPEDEVESLFDRIRADQRHTALRLISRQTVERREFKDWPMGFVEYTKDDLRRRDIVHLTPVEILALDRARARQVLGQFQDSSWRRRAAR